MKKGVVIISISVLCFAATQHCKAQLNPNKIKPSDTAGIADIESRLDDLKDIAGDMTTKITTCDDIETIKRYTALVQGIDDTILNHIVPVYDGFLTFHPDQYEPLRNINDLADHIITTSNIAKAKKLNDKIIAECDNLNKAK